MESNMAPLSFLSARLRRVTSILLPARWTPKTAVSGYGASFRKLIDARDEWMLQNLPRDSAEYLIDIYEKTKQKRLARRLGLPVAADLLPEATLNDAFDFIKEMELDRFVIKPLSSRSSCGCRAVIREGNGYFDLMSRNRLSLEQLQHGVRREYAKLKRPDQWMVEELLSPEGDPRLPIEDLKFYCFGNSVELILQKTMRFSGRARSHQVQWYTREWTPVQVGKYTGRIDRRISPPACAEQLVQVAERAAAHLCYPFIRVDLYPSSRGVVFGEFTPGPGGADQFDENWSRRLYTRWIESAERIRAGVQDGTLVPLPPV